MRFQLAGLAFCAVLLGAADGTTASPPGAGSQWHMAVNEEFTSLNDVTKVSSHPPSGAFWFYRTAPGPSGASDDRNAFGTVQVVHLPRSFSPALPGDSDHWVLKINGQNHPYQGYTWLGGGITTIKQYGYGYYEVRALLPGAATPGWHSAFWLRQEPVLPGDALATNEIDIFEANSGKKANVSAGISCGTYLPYGDNGSYGGGTPAMNSASWGAGAGWNTRLFPPDSPVVDATASWHTYGVEWSPTAVTWYVDGTSIGQTVGHAGAAQAANVLLSMIADYTGPFAGGAAVYFDYFRFYTREYFPDLAARVPTSSGNYSAPVLSKFPGGQSQWSVSTLGLNEVGATRSASLTFVAGASAAWPVPRSASGASPLHCEVYAWNSDLWANSLLRADLPIYASDPVVYQIKSDAGIAASASVDQTLDGQQWIWLGSFDFSGSSGEGVSLTTPPYSTAHPPTAPIRASTMVYRPINLAFDSFSGGTLASSLWTPTGSDSAANWPVANGTLRQPATTGEHVLVSAPTAGSWTNYFVRATITLHSGNSNTGLIARYVDASNYYLCRVLTSSGTPKLQIMKKAAGVWSHLGSADLWGVGTGSSFAVNFEVRAGEAPLGSSTRTAVLTAYLNGQLMVTTIDPAPLSSPGRMGVRTYASASSFNRLGAGD